MADCGDRERHNVSPSPQPASKRNRPRTHDPEHAIDSLSANPRKSLKRSATVGSRSSDQVADDQLPDYKTATKEGLKNVPIEVSAVSTENATVDTAPLEPSVQNAGSSGESSPPEPDRSLNMLAPDLANDSEASNGSSGTITRTYPVRQDSLGMTPGAKPRKQSATKAHALNFLDSDSPQVTPESIRRTVKEASKPSPEMRKSASPSALSTSSTSSGLREDMFDVFVDHETDPSTSPEHSIDGDARGRVFSEAGTRPGRPDRGRKRTYGTPEMPRGTIQYPHVPPEELTPRAPNQHLFKRLPRAEKLPLTGYELLASRLSTLPTDRSGTLRPIYRRFEALNHRMLLYLQDEISELEEKLHRLDTTDTQNRRLPNGILPASRRAELMSGGEFQWHRTELLGQIGWKLDQYNRVLSSFRETLSLPTPTMGDVSQYRSFLANYAPIVEAESQYLDAMDDLVYVGYSEEDEEVIADEDALATPTSRSDIADFQTQRRVSSVMSQSDFAPRHEERSTAALNHESSPHNQKPPMDKGLSMRRLLVAIAVAMQLPIITFLVIPGFIGRMTVVFLVGSGILGFLAQGGGGINFQATQEFFIGVGLYGGIMAVFAGLIN
ncbi:hypothetical protein F4808DRAFT_460493 [Astrocystis sublimbata]|nr:hypothetical protein F4808DRAFT_460493 [Astrocystis sublimbata]